MNSTRITINWIYRDNVQPKRDGDWFSFLSKTDGTIRKARWGTGVSAYDLIKEYPTTMDNTYNYYYIDDNNEARVAQFDFWTMDKITP